MSDLTSVKTNEPAPARKRIGYGLFAKALLRAMADNVGAKCNEDKAAHLRVSGDNMTIRTGFIEPENGEWPLCVIIAGDKDAWGVELCFSSSEELDITDSHANEFLVAIACWARDDGGSKRSFHPTERPDDRLKPEELADAWHPGVFPAIRGLVLKLLGV
jgi:hypothetical protein